MRFIIMLAVLLPALAILLWVLRARISRFHAQADRRRAIDQARDYIRGEEEIIDAEAELSHEQERLTEKRRREERRGGGLGT